MKNYILDKVNKLREIINDPRKQYELLKRKRDWSKLCTCIDTIEDTEAAISSYLELNGFDAYTGGYLYLYGILQALFLQQDAVSNLYDGIFATDKYLKVMLNKHKSLRDIREIRNDSIGHPTNRNGKSYHSIVQHSICKTGFSLSSDLEECRIQFSYINILEIINTQVTEINSVLNLIVSTLEEEIKVHKDQYKEDKLGNILQLRGYCIEKLSNCAYVNGLYYEDSDLAFVLLEGIIEKYHMLYNKVKERYGYSLDSIEFIHPKLEHVFNRLKFYRDNGGLYQNYDAIVMIDALNEYLTQVEQIAGEIDEEYEGDNSEEVDAAPSKISVIFKDDNFS
jgi:hypothetical protein